LSRGELEIRNDKLEIEEMEKEELLSTQLHVFDSTTVVPYQLCPKCNGDGDLSRYNSPAVMGTNARPICDVCNGNKIIPMHQLLHNAH
jgi:hypothetical protein